MKIDKKRILKILLKILRYLAEGVIILAFIYFILSLLMFLVGFFTRFIKNPNESYDFNFFLKFVFSYIYIYILFTFMSVPVAGFFSYRVDQIRKKLEVLRKSNYTKNRFNYFLLKIFLGVPIILLSLLSAERSFYTGAFLARVFKMEGDPLGMEIFITSFITPFILILLFSYFLEKFLISYYKKKNLEKS